MDETMTMLYQRYEGFGLGLCLAFEFGLESGFGLGFGRVRTRRVDDHAVPAACTCLKTVSDFLILLFLWSGKNKNYCSRCKWDTKNQPR